MLELCLPSTLSIPKPTVVVPPLVLSYDLLEETDLDDLVGLDGVGVLSTRGAETGTPLSLRPEAAGCLGDIAIESLGLDGSTALFRCKKKAGESARLAFGVVSSSKGRDVARLSVDETWLEFLLELCLSALSTSRRPRGLAEVWYKVVIAKASKF